MAKTKGSKPAMADAEKSAKFKELAEKRVTRALKAISGVSKLAGSRYKYTEGQIEKIEEAFKGALQHMHNAFAGKKTGGQGFTL